MLARTLAVLTLPALLGADPARGKLPWKLDRSYRYVWFHEDRKVGDIVFRFSKVEEVTGTVYRLSSHRRREHNGHSYRAQSDLYFLPDGSPLRYEEESVLSTLSGAEGRQEVRIRFEDGRVTSTHVNNGKEDKAVHAEAEAPPGTRLFSAYALEQWTLLALELDGKEKRIDVFYPTFGKTIPITFTPAESADGANPTKEEETGKEDAKEPSEDSEASRKVTDSAERSRKSGATARGTTYRFQNIDYRYEGSIRVGEKGRLVRYRSGPLELVLDTAK